MRGNRATGPGLEFWGGSSSPIPSAASSRRRRTTREEILIGEVDLQLIEETRRNWPFLRDRRIDAYAPITKRFLDPWMHGPRMESRKSRCPFNGLQDTPRELGYRMPAEWEPHDATWLAWPHNRDDWPGKFQPIPWVYAEIVRLLSARERVRIAG